jgi:hypothetical protein
MTGLVVGRRLPLANIDWVNFRISAEEIWKNDEPIFAIEYNLTKQFLQKS